MMKRFISNDFGEKVLAHGKIKEHITTFCDNGKAELYDVTYTNGVDFIIMMLNGIIISVS